MTKERGHPMLPADVSASAHSLAANDTVPTPPVLTTPVNSSTAALASAAVASVAALVNDTTRNASVAIANNSLRLIQSIDDPKGAKGEGDIIDEHAEKQNVILLVFVIAVLPVLFVSACCCVQPRMPWSSAEPKKTDQ